MKLPLDLFLACKYLKPKRTFVSFITLLSILGPTLGVAILIVVNSIMQGFQDNIKKSIMDWQAHLHVTPAWNNAFNDQQVLKTMKIMKGQGIVAAPVITESALLQVAQNQRQTCVPKIAIGINPKYERHITSLINDKFQGTFDLKEKEAIVGWRMAAALGLNIGSQFLLHSPSRLTQNIQFTDDGQLDVKSMDEVYIPEKVTVVGIFNLGISDLDSNVIYMHIDQVADLHGYEWRSATSIQGKVKTPMEMDGTVRQLNAALNPPGAPPLARITTWQQRNAQLFETLRVEHLLLLFLMTFILLVASFSIAATLITVVVKKTREIGVLKAVGISSFTVARIFVIQGLVIGVIGALLGTALGVLIVHFRTPIAGFISWIVGHEVFPAELYHLSELPANLAVSDILQFNALAILICIGSALIPSLFAAMMTPAKSLQEA